MRTSEIYNAHTKGKIYNGKYKPENRSNFEKSPDLPSFKKDTDRDYFQWGAKTEIMEVIRSKRKNLEVTYRNRSSRTRYTNNEAFNHRKHGRQAMSNRMC